MNALANNTAPVSSVPSLQVVPRKPSPRIMRRVGQTQDKITVDGKKIVRELNAGETTIDWKPKTLPLFTFPRGTNAVQAGSAMAIVREGYECEPLGVVTDTYRPVNHHETITDVAGSTEGRATLEGALIDGHGYHVVHAFRLTQPSENVVGPLPLVSRLTIVHDHTGTGSLRASVVCYLGNETVVGSTCFTRRIHVGAGAKDVGVGDKARWLGVIDAMLDTATLQQSFIVSLLKKANETKMTEELAETFEKHGVAVERERVSASEKKAAAERGEPEPVGAIVAQTALDVVILHHKCRKGKIAWGVWSRRLEGDALAALEKITGIEVPKQLFKRG